VNPQERSLGDLFTDLSQQTSTLIRQEMALARAEMSQKAAQVGRDAAYIGAGGALAYAATLSGVAAIVLGLVRLGLEPWLAALLTAALVGLVAFVLIRTHARSLRQQHLTPDETIDSVKETAQWLKNEAR
jgi:predicted lipid-binding transport protein (Tim44 family)